MHVTLTACLSALVFASGASAWGVQNATPVLRGAESAIDNATAEAETPAPQVTAASAAAPVAAPLIGATVKLDGVLGEEAAAYATFASNVRALAGVPLTSTSDLDAALETVSAQHHDKLAKGWVAYSALVASQSTNFLDGVRQAADYYGEDRVLAGLRSDARYAAQLTGGQEARDALVRAAQLDTGRLQSAGDTVKSKSYSLQTEAWAKRKTTGKTAKLKKISSTNAASPALIQASLTTYGRERLANALGESLRYAAQPAVIPASHNVTYAPRRSSPVIDRALTIAAIEALQPSGEATATDYSRLLQDPSTASCLQMARLDLSQCVAATHLVYEEIFCVAEHGMKDVSDCLSKTTQG